VSALTLYLTSDATSNPAPTTSYLLKTSANASEQQVNSGEFDNTFPGTCHAGQWRPGDNIASTTTSVEIDNTAGTTSPIRGSTAPTQTDSPTSPGGTQVGDLVIVYTWTPGTTGVPTHTRQTGFTPLGNIDHDDGSTDGRATAAYKIATSSGANTYNAFTSSGTPWSGLIVIKAGEFDPTSIEKLWRTSAVASVSSTGTGASNPASVTLTAGYHAHLVLAAVFYHLASSATVAITPPTNYTEEWEVAGSAATEMELSTRLLVGRAGQSEDPGAVTDDVTPNGTCSITIAIPLTPTSQQLTSTKAWFIDLDAAGHVGKTFALANWASQLRLQDYQVASGAARVCMRVSIVEPSGGAWVYKATLLGPTLINGAATGSLVLGQVGWRDQTEARHTITNSAANFSSTFAAIQQHKLASNEGLLVEFGFCDADSTTDRSIRLLLNTSNSFITTPFLGTAPEVTDVYPPSGNLIGGKLIEITGTGFATGDVPSIDGRDCTSITVHSSTRITCRTPMGKRLGARTVKVTNTDTLYGELAAGFTYNHPISDLLGARLYRFFFLAISTGGTLTWYDAMDNGDMTQSTAANLPTVGSVPSGLTSVIFDGSASPNQDFVSVSTGLMPLPDWSSSHYELRSNGVAVDSVPNQPTFWISMNSGSGINDDCVQITNALGGNYYISGDAHGTTVVTDSVLRRYTEHNAAGTNTLYQNGSAQATTDASSTLGTNWRRFGIEYGYQPVVPDRRYDGAAACLVWAYDTSSFSSDLSSFDTAMDEALNGNGSPTISDCDPGTGQEDDVVEVIGTQFEDGLTVEFGSGNYSDEVFVISKTSAFALVPAGSGIVNVIVKNPVAATSATLTNGFEYAGSTGTGSAAASPLAASGSGLLVFSATGAAAMAPLAGSGTANEIFIGSGNGALSSLAGTGTAEEDFVGTGAGTISPLAGTGNGAEVFAGSGSAAIAPLAGTGNASEVFAGSGSAAASPLEGAGSGSLEFRGSGSAALNPMAGSGTSEIEVIFVATGSAELSSFDGSGSAIETFEGSGSAEMSMSGSGSAVEAFQGSGTAEFSSFECAGTGLEVFVCSGGAALRSLACEGAAVVNASVRPVIPASTTGRMRGLAASVAAVEKKQPGAASVSRPPVASSIQPGIVRKPRKS
jgi:hypothetical protein